MFRAPTTQLIPVRGGFLWKTSRIATGFLLRAFSGLLIGRLYPTNFRLKGPSCDVDNCSQSSAMSHPSNIPKTGIGKISSRFYVEDAVFTEAFSR